MEIEEAGGGAHPGKPSGRSGVEDSLSLQARNMAGDELQHDHQAQIPKLPRPGGESLDPDSTNPAQLPVVSGNKHSIEDVRRQIRDALRLANEMGFEHEKHRTPDPASPDPVELIEPARETVGHGRALLSEWEADGLSGLHPVAQAKLVQSLRDHVDQLDFRLAELQNHLSSGKPPSSNLLGQICDGIIRVTVITVIGGLLGGPLLAFATQGLIGEKILEMTLASLIASTSTEAAATVASKQDYNKSRPSVDMATRYGVHDLKVDDSVDADIQRRYFGNDPPIPEKSWRPSPPHL